MISEVLSCHPEPVEGGADDRTIQLRNFKLPTDYGIIIDDIFVSLLHIGFTCHWEESMSFIYYEKKTCPAIDFNSRSKPIVCTDGLF